ncbi:MAG: hypothetical protein KDD60_12525, partial [Bdellovibrionales bacterium]|nr:hypothetical protein [Bdellovibrionales bacterium]
RTRCWRDEGGKLVGWKYKVNGYFNSCEKPMQMFAIYRDASAVMEALTKAFQERQGSLTPDRIQSLSGGLTISYEETNWRSGEFCFRLNRPHLWGDEQYFGDLKEECSLTVTKDSIYGSADNNRKNLGTQEALAWASNFIGQWKQLCNQEPGWADEYIMTRDRVGNLLELIHTKKPLVDNIRRAVDVLEDLTACSDYRIGPFARTSDISLERREDGYCIIRNWSSAAGRADTINFESVHLKKGDDGVWKLSYSNTTYSKEYEASVNGLKALDGLLRQYVTDKFADRSRPSDF